jgi:phosphoglycolate phosphatase
LNCFNTVIFDLDGTLMDTTQGVLNSLHYMIKFCGLPQLDNTALKRFIGPPIQRSLIEEFGVSPEQAQEYAEIFRNQYKDVHLLEAQVYDGIRELLAYLKQQKYLLAVATYKRFDYTLKLLEAFDLSRYFDSINGADYYNRLTKSDILEKCIVELGVQNRTEIVLIGDSENDAIGAQRAGIDFIGVTYGFGFHTKSDVDRYPNFGSASAAVELNRFFASNRT